MNEKDEGGERECGREKERKKKDRTEASIYEIHRNAGPGAGYFLWVFLWVFFVGWVFVGMLRLERKAEGGWESENGVSYI